VVGGGGVKGSAWDFPFYGHRTQRQVRLDASDRISMTWPQYCRGECTFDGERIALPPLEAKILMVLLIRRGEVVSTTEMIEAIYPNPDLEPDWAESIIFSKFSHLRDKLPGLIETVWGWGKVIPIPA